MRVMSNQATTPYLWWLIAAGFLLPQSSLLAATTAEPEGKTSPTLCDGSSLSADWQVVTPKSKNDAKKAAAKPNSRRDKQSDASSKKASTLSPTTAP